MAQIPRLNRAEPSAGPKNARINMQVQDNGSEILQQTQQLASVGDAGMQLFQKVENSKIETLGNLAEIEFNQWNEGELNKLNSKYKDGLADPTDDYKKYDEAVLKKKEEILGSRSDASDRVKSYVSAKLDRTIAGENIKAGRQRGAHHETFENNVHENALKSKKDAMVTAAVDPELFSMNIRGMKDLITQRGLKQGTVKVLEEGVEIPKDAETDKDKYHTYQDVDGKYVKVELSDLAVARFKKERAEGIKNSIDVLTASGKTVEAKELREKYSDALDPISKAKVDTKLTKAGYKEEANAFLAENAGLDPDEFLKNIDDIDDEGLKSEVLKQKKGQEANIEYLRKTSENRNYEYLAKDIFERQKSDRPFTSIAELEKDKKYDLMYDKLSAKQQKAIRESIEAPKETDPKTEARVQEIFLAGDVMKMSPEKFQEELVGASKADKAKWNTRYYNMRNDTSGERRATVTLAGKMLTDAMLDKELIRKDDRNRITGDNDLTLVRARMKMIDWLDDLGPQSPEQLQKHVDKFIAAEIKGKVYKPDIAVGNKSAGSKVKTEAQLRKGFKEKYGRYPNPGDQKLFEAFAKVNS